MQKELQTSTSAAIYRHGEFVSKLDIFAYRMFCHCERSEASEAISLMQTAFGEIATHASGMLAMTES